MALQVHGKPNYKVLFADSPIVHLVYDSAVIQASPAKYKIKYIADIYVTSIGANMITAVNKVATLKVIPNATGRGIFDLSSVVRNYTSPDYEGGIVNFHNNTEKSTYNGDDWSRKEPHTIHQIDNFSTNRYSMKYIRARFKIEYAETATGDVSVAAGHTDGDKLLIFNGVINGTDVLNHDATYTPAYNLNYFNFIMNDTDAKFLTNAPTKQYIRDDDFCTLSYFTEMNTDDGLFQVGSNVSSNTYPSVYQIKTQFYYNGSTTGGVITKTSSMANGGTFGNDQYANNKLQFVGVGTGNLIGSGQALPANWDYYTVIAYDDLGVAISDTYSFYRQVDCGKGYENIRLTWLNKFGTWDYYNFNKKSVRGLSSDRKSYKQISGVWNEDKYRQVDHLGGQKTFHTNIKESITINTDFITETEAQWLEELFISNDVYILNQRTTDILTALGAGIINKYIQPVQITSESYVKKTTANDKLIQYTLQLETSRTKRSQRI